MPGPDPARELQRSLAVAPGQYNHRQLAILEHAVKNADARYTVQSHAGSHNVAPETARQDLVSLEAQGLLHKAKAGKAFVWSPAMNIADRLHEANAGP
jgi:DeoR/GlpR family transcriptional regulator of sugar metabolism